MSELVEKLKEQVIQTMRLTDVAPDQIDPEAPLFGEGLGLDSIDALELVVMLEKDYRIRITDVEAARKAFASVNALAQFVEENSGSCEKNE